ncbi:MAG: tRNA epoxyqueuosine(34) reductase QueG [Bacteroidota bacterium]
MIKSKYTKMIKQEATRLGFMYCGVSKAEFLEEEAPRLERWLNRNMHGKMAYMEHYFDERLDPRLLVDNAKSVISLIMNFYPSETQKDPKSPKISKYAYGKDYHLVIKDKLKILESFIRKNIGEVNCRGFVDSASVLEKAWAKKSGLGWIGKNSILINKQSGSFFFIAEFIVDLKLDYDSSNIIDANRIKDYCGNCTECIDACPTNAIIEPYIVDGSKCISYFTIEPGGNIPAEMQGKFENRVFGCDICQDVCPWNKFATPHSESEFEPHQDLLKMTREEWEKITEEVFDKVFKNSAVKRIKFNGLKRNIKFLNHKRSNETLPSISEPVQKLQE